MIDLSKKPFYLSEEDINWVNDTLNSLSVDEKIGQLNQYTNDANPTGPLVVNPNKEKEINKAKRRNQPTTASKLFSKK